MGQSVLSVRMDPSTKEAFSAFCEEAGMSVSTAVNLFARQVVRDQRMPFVVSLVQDDSSRFCEASQEKVLRIDEIALVVSRAARCHKAIRSVGLFGSYARGEATAESDIDLRVICDKDGLTMLELGAFIEEVRSATGKEVDAVTAADLGEGSFADAVAREERLIYDRS